MIIIDKYGKYIKVDPVFTNIKETPDGCVVTYTIIKDD